MSEFPSELFSAEHRLREPADHLRRFAVRVMGRLPIWEAPGSTALHDAQHFVKEECESGVFFHSSARFVQHWSGDAASYYVKHALGVTLTQQTALQAFVTMMELYVATDENDLLRRERDRQGACDAARMLLGEVNVAATECTSEKSAETDSRERKRRPRGRPRADYLTRQLEEKLVKEWKQARESGVLKDNFAQDKKIPVDELERILDRVRGRISRSDK